jgi:hypothetical protein
MNNKTIKKFFFFKKLMSSNSLLAHGLHPHLQSANASGGKSCWKEEDGEVGGVHSLGAC